MTAAEFTVTETSGGEYTIQGSNGLYLTNTNGQTYFENQAANMELPEIQDADGNMSYRIKRADSTRHVFFNYPDMTFNAMSYIDTSADGDYEIEFLEKQDAVSNLDDIPGYRRASTITSGKKYLITEFFGDGIIVLYPVNGVKNQSKLYRSWEAQGIYIHAVSDTGETPVTVTVDGIPYDVSVSNNCTHEGERYREGVVDATCETAGSTGTLHCSICSDVLEEAEVVEALGHDYPDEWQVTEEVTLETDGTESRVCHRNPHHIETRPISAYVFGKTTLSELLAEYAQGLNPAEDYYTSESKAAYDAAVGAANEILTVEEDTPENRAQLLSAIAGLQAAYESLAVAVGQVTIGSDDAHPVTDGTITLEIGESATLTASVEPEEATDKTIVWSIGDEDAGIASLTANEDGSVTVTARSEGTVIVTAAAGDKSASCTVHVPAPEAVTVSDNGREIPDGGTCFITRRFLKEVDNGDRTLDLSFNSKGDTHILEVSVTDENGNAFAEGEEILTYEITGQQTDDLDEDLDTENDLEFSEEENESGEEEAAGLKLNLHPIKSGTAKVTVYCKEDAETVKTEFTVAIETIGTIQYVDEEGNKCGVSAFIVEETGTIHFDGYTGADEKSGYTTVYPENTDDTLAAISAGQVLIEVPIEYLHRVTVESPGYIDDGNASEEHRTQETMCKHMTQVTIRAAKTNDLGEKFVSWQATTKEGSHTKTEVVSYSASYTMYVRNNVTLTPMYKRPDAAEIPASISSVLGEYKGRAASNTNKHVYHLTASRVVPAAATKTGAVDEQGFLISTKEISKENLAFTESGAVPTGSNGKALFTKKAGKTTGLVGSYVVDVMTVNTPIYVKSYVAYTDKDGVKHIVYSDMMTVAAGSIEQ